MKPTEGQRNGRPSRGGTQRGGCHAVLELEHSTAAAKAELERLRRPGDKSAQFNEALQDDKILTFWEVDHGRTFPVKGEEGWKGVVSRLPFGFGPRRRTSRMAGKTPVGGAQKTADGGRDLVGMGGQPAGGGGDGMARGV